MASETLGILIPATIVATFFLFTELPPQDNLLAGDNDILLELGDAALLPPVVGDGCRYLDGTTIAGSLDDLRFSSFAAARLGTTHLDGTGDADLLTFPAGDGSLSFSLLPADIDLCLFAAGDVNL